MILLRAKPVFGKSILMSASYSVRNYSVALNIKSKFEAAYQQKLKGKADQP